MCDRHCEDCEPTAKQDEAICENDEDYYWPSCNATIKLPLRRTLVRLGILLDIGEKFNKFVRLLNMGTALWISISAIVVSASIAIFLAYRRGDLKTLSVYASPSKFKRNFKFFFFSSRGLKIPAVGVINFFELPKSNHKRICFHIYFTVENLSDYTIDELSISFTYPRKYFDENDNNFFQPTSKGQKRNLEYVFIDDELMQVTYKYESLHPKSGCQIIHPIIISIEDFAKPLDIDHPFFFDISDRGFSFDAFGYIVSAKNLKRPIQSHFWLINVLGIPYKKFFNREKKFLDAITKNFKLEKYVFEHRNISVYKEGKYKKDVLVVPSNKMHITYSHFPPLKEPHSGRFNFETTK